MRPVPAVISSILCFIGVMIATIRAAMTGEFGWQFWVPHALFLTVGVVGYLALRAEEAAR